jgi:hypothetical protein
MHDPTRMATRAATVLGWMGVPTDIDTVTYATADLTDTIRVFE